MAARNKSTDRIRPPDDCSPDQLDAFVELVSQGGQVRATGLRERIGRAHWLGFHYEGHQLAAVAGLKRPGEKYRARVFRKAKAALPATVFCAELGWVFTREEFRGRRISRQDLFAGEPGQCHAIAHAALGGQEPGQRGSAGQAAAALEESRGNTLPGFLGGFGNKAGARNGPASGALVMAAAVLTLDQQERFGDFAPGELDELL